MLDICIRIVSVTGATARQAIIWHKSSIRFASKHKLYKSFVIAILLYEEEMLTLLADKERIQAFSTKFLWRLF